MTDFRETYRRLISLCPHGRSKVTGGKVMDRDSGLYKKYVEILEKELLPAMGCTEPIAIAYAAARAREVLGDIPDRVKVIASGNIIKNVKSVIVPNTGGLMGIETAAAAGIIAGRSERLLEVISEVSEEEKRAMRAYLDRGTIEVEPANTGLVFDLKVEVSKGEEEASVRIVGDHTNIVSITRNGNMEFEKPFDSESGEQEENVLSLKGILDFARTCDLDDVREVIKRQIDCNTAVSDEGIRNSWGAEVGRTILKAYGDKDVRVRAKARAAAGSDARMSGCELPVVINSGSGNQGITVSVPVMEYARELKSSEEELYRALVLANLLGLHQKAGIGRLSAYCGAVSAGCAAGAAIAYLMGESDKVIEDTVINCLATTSGIVCDGAKPSCASKIAESIDAVFLALAMAKEGHRFKGGDGIVKEDVEDTIKSVGRLGKDGMRETDREILDIMLDR